VKRQERLDRERAILEEVIANGGIKESVRAAWCRRARRRQASFYKRLDEISPESRSRFEALHDGRTLSTDAYYDLSDGIDIIRDRCREAGEEPSLAALRDYWEEKRGHADLPFKVYWQALPESDRRDFKAPLGEVQPGRLEVNSRP
jgi:hypothetical protein